VNAVTEALRRAYGLSVTELTPLEGGYVHQVWRAGAHVVKLYRGEAWGPAAVGPTLTVQAYAAASGHPVPDVLRPAHGAGAAGRDGTLGTGAPVADWLAPLEGGISWIAVMAFASGRKAAPGEMTPAMAREAGRTLGRLHRTLAELPVPDGSPFATTSAKVAERTARLQAEALAQANPDEGDRLAMEVCQWRLDLLERYQVESERYAGDPVQIVHGDYYPGNLLFGPDGTVAAVLDWDFSGARPRGLEVARAAVETGLVPAEGPGRLDQALVQAFLGGYTAEQPLPADQRQAMFRLWFDYLLGSLYPLSVRRKPGAGLPVGWLDLARRRHQMLLLLDRYMPDLGAWALTSQ
jgi:hypothetical protein